jgi:hypothetical protein
LLVAVPARAVDGRANEAVVAALASAFGLRPAQVVIVTGHRGRDKIVELVGGPEEAVLAGRLTELLADPTGR